MLTLATFTIPSPKTLSSCSSCRLRSCLSCKNEQDKQDRKRHDEQDDIHFNEIVKMALTFMKMAQSGAYLDRMLEMRLKLQIIKEIMFIF